MTIKCISTEHMWKEWGQWWMSGLDTHRTEFMLEAAKAEISSKSQNLFVNRLGLNTTTSMDWSCAVCKRQISVKVFRKKKHHWKEFLCSNCNSLTFNQSILISMRAFHSEVQKRIRTNLET